MCSSWRSSRGPKLTSGNQCRSSSFHCFFFENCKDLQNIFLMFQSKLTSATYRTPMVVLTATFISCQARFFRPRIFTPTFFIDMVSQGTRLASGSQGTFFFFGIFVKRVNFFWQDCGRTARAPLRACQGLPESAENIRFQLIIPSNANRKLNNALRRET